jgi:hypothetical protein
MRGCSETPLDAASRSTGFKSERATKRQVSGADFNNDASKPGVGAHATVRCVAACTWW